MNNIEISVDITYRCPYSCCFCSSCEEHACADMVESTARHVSAFLSRISFLRGQPIEVSITGGEPLLLSTLEERVSLWRHTASRATLCTSGGIAITRDRWQRLRTCGLDTVRLSLHTVDKRIARAIFGDTYSLEAALSCAHDIRDAGIELQINFVLSLLTREKWRGVICRCAELGVSRLRVLGLSRQGRAVECWERIALPDDIMWEVVRDIEIAGRAKGLTVEVAGVPGFVCSHSDQGGKCLGGRSFFHINTDGTVAPCPATKSDKESYLGHVDEDMERILSLRSAVLVKTCAHSISMTMILA